MQLRTNIAQIARTKAKILLLFSMCQPQLLSASPPLRSHSKQSPPQQISVLSYNLENLWDAHQSNTPNSSDQSDNTLQYAAYGHTTSNWYTPEILHSKIDSILTTLKLAEVPAILALQEVESAGGNSKVFEIPYTSKQTLRDKLVELGYRTFIIGPQDPKNPVSVTTAMVSKLPLTPLASITIGDDPDNSSARDVQVVELTLDSKERVLFFNSHWKSKRGGGNEQERIEIAYLVRERIDQEKQSYAGITHIVVLGDLNSAYYEAPLVALGSTGNEAEMLAGPQKNLYNLWYELPVQSRGEHSFNGLTSTLSGILISDSLYQIGGLSYADNSFEVIGHKSPAKEILLGADGIPFRWQIAEDKGFFTHVGTGYSDHLPLLMRFNYNKKVRNTAKQLITPSSTETELIKPDELMLDKVNLCKKSETTTWEQLRKETGGDVTRMLNRCVKIEVPSKEQPLKLGTVNKYKHVTFAVHEQTFALAMTRGYDWRPNIDDPRVTADFVKQVDQDSSYSSMIPHPKSNQCYTRKVLQGPGGSLRSVVGRIGYNNGLLSIFVGLREHIKLENLPAKKAEACQW